MEQKLKAHKVMITGASGGLGERIYFRRSGKERRVILAARRRDRLEEL